MDKTSVKSDIRIRTMELADIDEVMEVDRASFPSPWPKHIFCQEIKENDFAYYYVMERDGRIIGYLGMWMILGDAQVTNIALLPEVRGQGLGEKLFGHGVKLAIANEMKRLSLEVRVSNIAAQKLYRKFGLVPGGIRKNYYTDNHEDAIVMWVDLS